VVLNVGMYTNSVR